MSVIPNRSVRNLHQMTLLFEFRFLVIPMGLARNDWEGGW